MSWMSRACVPSPDRGLVFSAHLVSRPPKATLQALSCRPRNVLGMVVLFGITGCSSFLQGVIDFQQGWHTAEVIEVGRASEIKARGYIDCRKSASEWQIANSRFAILAYRMNRRRHVHIVLVPNDLEIVPGDTIYPNVDDCDWSSRVLAGQSTLVGSERQ